MDAWLRTLVAEGLVEAAEAREALRTVAVPEGQPAVAGPPVDSRELAELAGAEPLRAAALTEALVASGAGGIDLEDRLRGWLEGRAATAEALRSLLLDETWGGLVAAWLDALLERLDALALPVRIVAVDLEFGLSPEPPGTVAVVQAVAGDRDLLLGLAGDAAALAEIAGRMTEGTGIDAAELGTDALRELVNIAVGRTVTALADDLRGLRPEPPLAAPLAALARDVGTTVRTTLLTAAPVEALVWIRGPAGPGGRAVDGPHER